MHLYITIISLITLNFNQLGSKDDIYNVSSFSLNYRTIFDSHMEKIEQGFRDKNMDLACQESKNALTILKKYRRGLIQLEPNYDWTEMQALLAEIPKKYCK